MILVRNSAAQMEAYRRRARDTYGSQYESNIAPYISALVLLCRRDKSISPEDGARYIEARMKGRRKMQNKPWSNHFTACLFSAALEIQERKLLDQNVPTPNPPPESLPEIPENED